MRSIDVRAPEELHAQGRVARSPRALAGGERPRALGARCRLALGGVGCAGALAIAAAVAIALAVGG